MVSLFHINISVCVSKSVLTRHSLVPFLNWASSVWQTVHLNIFVILIYSTFFLFLLRIKCLYDTTQYNCLFVFALIFFWTMYYSYTLCTSNKLIKKKWTYNRLTNTYLQSWKGIDFCRVSFNVSVSFDNVWWNLSILWTAKDPLLRSIFFL